MEKLYGLDLFSGIGGITKALESWVEPIAYCEIEEYAQATLLARMADCSLPTAPIWDNITTLKSNMLPVRPDIIYGGFPCQDISVVGAGGGLAGERSGLFYEVCRLVEEIQPRFVFLENVPAVRTRGLREIINKFNDLGYDCRWTCVSAAEVGAPHIRKRWFMLAHARSARRQQNSSSTHANEGANARRPAKDDHVLKRAAQSTVWSTSHTSLHGVANGLPFRVDRTTGLGNAVVPTQVQEAFKRLISL